MLRCYGRANSRHGTVLTFPSRNNGAGRLGRTGDVPALRVLDKTRPPNLVGMTSNVERAQDLAATHMADPLPRRWAHVQAVASKAANLRLSMGGDADILIAAAWLHDIGYAPGIKTTGFHPLDGARYLQDRGEDPRLCALVANHSGAMREAELRGLADDLGDFPDERSLARDALWYCDMTTSPDGHPVTFDERLAEICRRYGMDHTVPRAITAASPEIRAAIDRVVARANAPAGDST